MIAFSPNNLSSDAETYLQALTNDVASYPTLAAQYERAKTLWEARKNRQTDQTYSAIKSANDFPDLLSKILASKHPIVKQDMPFDTEKARLLNVLENDIKDDLFPTVWAEMKLQRVYFTRLYDLFDQNPETLNWE